MARMKRSRSGAGEMCIRDSYKLEFIMDGDLDELVNALAAEHRAELLAEMAENV